MFWVNHFDIGYHAAEPISEIWDAVTILSFKARLFCVVQNGSKLSNRFAFHAQLIVDDNASDGLSCVIVKDSCFLLIDRESLVISDVSNASQHVSDRRVAALK